MRSLSEVVLALPGRGDLGGADCEQVRDAVLAQPVAAVSSLGYVAVGGYLAWAWSGLPGGERRVARTYAGLLVLVGAGSVLYHGPQGPAAGWSVTRIVGLYSVGCGVANVATMANFSLTGVFQRNSLSPALGNQD